MKASELSFDELKDILEHGFYYFTRCGTIKHVDYTQIGCTYVKSSISHKIRFPISDLNKTWFIDKDTCACAVSKYISSLPVPVSIVKKISKLTKEDTIWYKNDDGKVNCFTLDDYESFYYLPTEQCLECYYDYDNGLYCETRADQFPLSEYGKTWALTKEELLCCTTKAQKTKLLSELMAESDEYDFLGHHMEYLYKDDETGDYHLCLRSHDSPSYGYCEPEYEDTPEWFDEWWSLFADINLTKGIVERHYGGPDYDGYKVIIDVEIDYSRVEELIHEKEN